MINRTTQISDDLLRQIRDFVDEQADAAVGCAAYGANQLLSLLRQLNGETSAKLLARRGTK
jgi:hypothetical protein